MQSAAANCCIRQSASQRSDAYAGCMANGVGSVTVVLKNDKHEEEGTEELQSVAVTDELASLFSYAHQWGEQEREVRKRRDPKDECTLTFSSMLAALMASNKPLCRWLQLHLGLRGVSPKAMTKSRVFE